MAKKITPIRISEKDKKEFARLAKNAKAKMRNVKKKYDVDLTGELEIPSLNSFQTRDQYNEWKDKQSSFTNKANTRYQFKKNKNNVVASKFELNEAERNFKIDVRNAEKERAKIEAQAKAGKAGAQENLMLKRPSNIRIPIPAPFKFENFHTREGLENRLEKLKERAEGVFYNKRLHQMKENWLDSVAGSFNSEADDILERIKWMNDEDFFEMYDEFKRFMSFELYDSKGQTDTANEGHLERIRHYLDEYESGELTFDLKGIPSRT